MKLTPTQYQELGDILHQHYYGTRHEAVADQTLFNCLDEILARLKQFKSSKFDLDLAVVVQEYESHITVNLERGAQKINVRLYPQNDNESQKSAIDFASSLARITLANWQSIDRRGLPYQRPFIAKD